MRAFTHRDRLELRAALAASDGVLWFAESTPRGGTVIHLTVHLRGSMTAGDIAGRFAHA